MKNGIGLTLLMVTLTFGLTGLLPQTGSPQEKAIDKKGKKPHDEKKDVDVTRKVREHNSKQFASPPTKFRKGHVSVRQLAKESLTKTKQGFVVQFPSKAPIPTPTFYKGNLFVSGGFHSKEYYCLNTQGECVWGITLDDDGPSSCVVEDDICVFNTESCTIFAVDAQTGKLLWSHWLGDPLMSTPAIANGKVFTAYPANGGGFLQQQNQGNFSLPQQELLQQKFQLQTDKPPTVQPKKGKSPGPTKSQSQEKSDDSPPDVGEGKKRPPATHVLACLDLKTGKILWQRWIDSDVMSAPVTDGDEVYAATFAGTVYRFKQQDGTILSAIQSRATSAPVIVGKDIFFTRRADGANAKVAQESILRLTREGNRKVYEDNKTRAWHLDQAVQSKSKLAEKGKSLDASNGFAGGAPQAANPGAALKNIGQGGVYTCQAFQGSRILNWGEWNFNCQGDEVFCTSVATGKKKWGTQLEGDLKKVGGSLAAPPVFAGGNLFLATVKGEILQVNCEDGKTEKTYKVGSPLRTQPIIQDGNIYVGTHDGKLVCIQTGNPKLTGWSAWGGNSAHSGTVASGD